MSEKGKPETINEYINSAPKEARTRLLEMLACLREAAPEAGESIKWGIPALSYHRILFTFAAFKHHISLYPTPSVIKALEKDLSEFETTKSTVKFPIDQPLPLPLIRKIAAYRVWESVEKDVKWM